MAWAWTSEELAQGRSRLPPFLAVGFDGVDRLAGFAETQILGTLDAEPVIQELGQIDAPIAGDGVQRLHLRLRRRPVTTISLPIAAAIARAVAASVAILRWRGRRTVRFRGRAAVQL